MGVWVLAVLLTALCCAALYYAAARAPVNAGPQGPAAEVNLYRARLAELERDLGEGLIAASEAAAARAELGRELLRQQDETAEPGPGRKSGAITYAAPALVAVLALATYALLGNPGLPAQPASGRPEIAARQQLLEAVAQAEARLREDPDDLRGWQALAPAYLRIGRYPDAEAAFRKVIALDGPTADRDTDLAEALMLANGGAANGEALALLQAAAGADPDHARSRYYLAGEATRAGRYQQARLLWTEVIALSPDDAPWLAVVREGLAFVTQALERAQPGPTEADIASAADLSPAEREAMIAGMVEGLAARLAHEGGSVEDWGRLIRARLVTGDTAQAERDYAAGLAGIADPEGRGRLTALARELGLTVPEAVAP